MTAQHPKPNAARILWRRSGSFISKSLKVVRRNHMKKLMLMLTAFGVAALSQPSFAQQPAAVHQEASDVSSYSAPTQKHVKKPKKQKAKKGAASEASAAAPAAAASQ